MGVITLTTDFGDSIYHAILKAVILKNSPNTKLITISNKIEQFNIKQAIFFLENTYYYFPDNTVHLVVVDPGVGSDRKGIIIKTKNYYFVGPDNGVFSFLKEQDVEKVLEITYKPQNISFTFHGRDIFAPVASKLLKDKDIKKLGEEIKWKDTFTSRFVHTTNREIIFIDDFGNIFLDIKYDEFIRIVKNKKFQIIFKNKKFEKINKFYYEVKKGEFLLLVNSLGYLEIAVREGSAKDVLNAKVGDKYEIKID